MTKIIKNQRPPFDPNVTVDRLTAMIVALAGEVSVARERTRTLEILLQEKGLLGPSDIDNFVPDAKEETFREQERTTYLDRIFWILQDAQDEETDFIAANKNPYPQKNPAPS